MVTAPVVPDQTVEITIQVPVARRHMEPAEVTWMRDADGWWWIRINGEAALALRGDRARALAGDILGQAPANPPPDPVPGV